MQIIKRRVPNNFNIFLFGDDHEGANLRHRKGWNLMCNMLQSSWEGVEENHNYGVDHGDIVEAILVDDKRYDPLALNRFNNAGKQRDQAIVNRRDIKHKLVTILEGNHPWKLKAFEGITERVCHSLSVPYGTWSCKIHWQDRRGITMFKSFHTHGKRTITSTADDPKRRNVNLQLTLKRHMKFMAGDAVLMSKGHSHKLIVSSPAEELYLISDEDKKIRSKYTDYPHTADYIHPDARWYINTGSFLKLHGELGFSGYAEMAEYDPVELGFVIVQVRNRRIDKVRKIKLTNSGKRVIVDPPLE